MNSADQSLKYRINYRIKSETSVIISYFKQPLICFMFLLETKILNALWEFQILNKTTRCILLGLLEESGINKPPLPAKFTPY